MADKDKQEKDRLFEAEAFRSVTHMRPEPDTEPPTERPSTPVNKQDASPASEGDHPQKPEPPKDEKKP